MSRVLAVGVIFVALVGSATAQTVLSYPQSSPATTVGMPGEAGDTLRISKPSGSPTTTLPARVDEVSGAGSKAIPATLVYPPAPNLPPEPPTEFQKFVTVSLGHELPMFGYSLFADVPSTFAPVDRVPVTPDYVIGPGDELIIRAWGQIDVDAHTVVDRNGAIYLPKVGNLTVNGLRFNQLQDYLRSAVGKVFRNFDLAVTLGQLRSIQIFVVGQAKRPGTYTVSSLSTLVNALFASGGPSSKGSMRRIQLKRDNKVVTQFDVYDLLLNGDKSNDVPLLPGDIIFIPPVGPQVAMAGSVNVPAIYELKSTTMLEEALQMSSGLSNVADGQKVRVERVDDRTTRRVDEFPLNHSGRDRQLQDGDVVYVTPLSPRFDNAVTLRGNVAVPGRYPWQSGMRIRDLIPSREALVTREYWLKQNLAAGDRNGDGWTSAKQAKLQGMEVRTDVQRTAPDINWDYAVIQRLNTQDLTTHLMPFNLGQAILTASDSNNLELQPGDIITIFSQADLRVPVHKQSKFVYLEGEFNSAGVYKVRPGETLRELVRRIGGLTPQAYLFGAEFTRDSTRVEQQKNLDELVQAMEREVDLQSASASTQTSTSDEAAAMKMKFTARQAQIAKLKELKATGRIVLELPPTAASVDALPDLTLEDGDRLYVPYRTSEVNVTGEVYNTNSFVYEPGRGLGEYLKQAGGTTRYADRSHMFLLRADGSVIPKKSGKGWWSGGFDDLKLMPGDTIVVPQHISITSTLKEVKDWTQIFSQFALGAAAVRILKNP